MKALILSITAGQGHNQAAKVMSDYLNDTGVECSFMDVYEYINPVLSESVSLLYLMSTKTLPKVYGGVYRMCEKRDAENSLHLLSKITNPVLAARLTRYLKEKDPDVIICTHIFAALLMTYISKKRKFKAKTIGVVTDFTIHPYWEDSDLDYYIIPNELLTIQGVKKGLAKEKFLPFGIPINPKFAEKHNRDDVCRELQIPNKRTVLIMSGSMGFGNILNEICALDRLDIPFQIISVCGNNKKIKARIDNTPFTKSVYNFGYADNVDKLMDISDCIITKPGGLTTSEALAKGLPMLMSNPIPGQEDRNVEFLLNAGAAIKISSTYPIDEAVYHFFSDENRQRLLKEACRSLGKPDSTEDLAKFIKGLDL